jgi:hypothetical protein
VCFGVCNVICPNQIWKSPYHHQHANDQITKIGFRPRQIRKVKSNMSIHTDIQKPIHRVCRGDVADNKIGMVMLSMVAY